jgi:hypothetical protein
VPARRETPKGENVKTSSLVAGAVVCLAAVTANAAGDRTQGTNVCGAGLEILDASGRSTGNCVGVRSGVPSPKRPNTLTLTDATQVKLNKPCGDKGGYWACPDGSFNQLSPKGEKYCELAPGTSLPLVVVKAKLHTGGFTFGSSLTVACGGSSVAGSPPMPTCAIPQPEQYSTIDDCIFWGYAPTNSSVDQRRFAACVRMARADYLGLGMSGTRRGIHIQPYTGLVGDQPECRASRECCDGCFEASWDQNGARCINHFRLKEIEERLVVLAGMSQDDARGSLVKRFKPSPSDTQSLCIEGATYDEDASKALTRNRSRVHLCTSTTAPMQITACHTTAKDPCPVIGGPCP